LQAKEDPLISIIVPTLNEEEHLKLLLRSLEEQRFASFEMLVIDGGSKDKTAEIAKAHGAEVKVLSGYGEFISRNIGANEARGELLLFTCADITFPPNLFSRIIQKFRERPALVAFTGPGYPFDAPAFGKVEYGIYNLVRYFFSKLPKPLKRFSTSTNFLVVRKDFFEKSGGFAVDDINADGLMGKKLLEMGEVAFSLDSCIYLSARRMKKMGFFAFNKHYLYVLENFLFSSSEASFMKSWKVGSKRKHRKIHEV
jgi:glycosyltransferase involved in cell wall biosynthesis